MRVRGTWKITPKDDLMHELGPEPNFNESMYFNMFDGAAGLGGFFRLGNRANEGYAEMTTCLYLPDGRVAFTFGRPPISDNAAFDAGGLKFEVVEPFKELGVRYDGDAVLLDDPTQMVDPKSAFTTNPHVTCTVELTYTGVCDIWHPSGPAPGAPLGHYEQMVAAAGTVRVGGETWSLDGFGVRDHSWGPRTWQKAGLWGRWLTGPLSREFGFMGLFIVEEGGPGVESGFVWDGSRLRVCDRFRVTGMDWHGPDYYPEAIEAVLGCDGDEWQLSGRVRQLIPLRHRKGGDTTRICEALMEWDVDGGAAGLGLAEITDQIVGGRPVSVTERT